MELTNVKIGQSYTIRTDIKRGVESSKGVAFISDMESYRGKTGTVTSVNNKGVRLDIDGGNYNWAPEFFMSDKPNQGDLVMVECIKSYPGCPYDLNTPFNTQYDPLFDNPDFFRVTKLAQKIEIEGYESSITPGSGVNWGCRSFTKEEMKTIVDAFNIIDGKELGIQVGRIGANIDSDKMINIRALNALYQAI